LVSKAFSKNGAGSRKRIGYEAGRKIAVNTPPSNMNTLKKGGPLSMTKKNRTKVKKINQLF